MSRHSKHDRSQSVQHSRHLSNIRNAQMTIPYRNGHISASLRATQIISSKAVLPAELIAIILNYVAIPDLLRCARVSRRLQEMVYDDTRWIQKLKLMGVWNEAKARQHFEDVMKKKAEAQRTRRVDDSRTAGGTLFDARVEEEQAKRKNSARKSDGFSELVTEPGIASGFDSTAALAILSRIRSIRGQARQEYAKAYVALSPFYNDLASSKGHSDHLIFRTYQTPEEQAQMLSSLDKFARQDITAGNAVRHEKLQSMVDIFQRAVLHEFHQGIEANDINGRMKRYAHVLSLLGRDQVASNMYISFIAELQTSHPAHRPRLCIDEVASGYVDMGPCNRFFELLANVAQEHTSKLVHIFPSNPDVVSTLHTKIWQVLAGYSTVLFDEAHHLNRETYCKAVAGTITNALSLVEQMQEEGQKLLRESFERHVDQYLTEELALFKEKCETEVSQWERQLSEQQASTESYFMSNVSRQAAKTDFLSSFKKVVMMPVTSFTKSKPTVLATTPAVAAEDVSRTSTPRPEAPTTELAAKAAIMTSRHENIKSLFSLQVAINLTQYAKTSLERAALLVRVDDGTRVKELCKSIFVELLRALGTRHVQAGFDKALEHLSDYNPRQVREYRNSVYIQDQAKAVGPLVTFVELVNIGDLIQQMIEVFYVQELAITKLSDRDDFLDAAVMEKKSFEQMLDARVASGLNKGIDVLMSEVEFIWSTTQQAADFNPLPIMREKQWSQPDIDVGASSTAQQVVEVVSEHTSMLVGSTEKNMLDVFQQEVAARLFGAVCKHVKRQRISVTGSIKLISDLNHYAAFITSLRQKAVLPYAAVLKEIGQIYLIHIDPPSGGVGILSGKLTKTQQQSKELATIIADTNRYWGILPVEEVYEFAERRADWHMVKGDVDRAMYGVGCSIM